MALRLSACTCSVTGSYLGSSRVHGLHFQPPDSIDPGPGLYEHVCAATRLGFSLTAYLTMKLGRQDNIYKPALHTDTS